MIFWICSYLTSRTQCVRVGDYLSEMIYCHSGVPKGSHLGLLFFIADINDVLNIFENVRVLAYADDLKLCMRVSIALTRLTRLISFVSAGLGLSTGLVS
jgi:hypothetical protein